MTENPLFFHISPDGCGEARLARLFRRNGHPAVCHDNGRLAEDILFSRARGEAALRPWPGTVLFGGLYRHAPHWRPPLEAWRQFAWLAERFPQARFILTTRCPEDWILDRLTRDGGAAARCHAHHRGCDTADLPELWEADWHAHLTAVDAFFDTLRDGLEQGRQVKLSGFGNFDLRDKRQRPGRNPKTGEEIPITARRVVTFRPGQKLKARVEAYAGTKP